MVPRPLHGRLSRTIKLKPTAWGGTQGQGPRTLYTSKVAPLTETSGNMLQDTQQKSLDFNQAGTPLIKI